MKKSYLSELQTRRQFFRQAACAAVGTVSLTNVLRDLSFMNSAVAQTLNSITDYRALICVFLNGGNDANNMVIYTDPSDYQSYAATRTSALALPNVDGSTATIQQLFVPGTGNTTKYSDSAGHTYGMHPAMSRPNVSSAKSVVDAFNNGNMALLLNVGTLSYPMTKAQYQNGSVPQPPQLYSHSDQQTQWQTSIPDQPPTSGWGGRIGDLMTSVNAGAVTSPYPLSMAVTLAGSNIFEVGPGNLSPQYSISTSGAVQLSGSVSGNRSTAFNGILNSEASFSDLQMKTYASVTEGAITTASNLSTTLTTIGTPAYLTNNFPSFSGGNVNISIPNTYDNTKSAYTTYSSSLMGQMAMVCKMIHAGLILGMKRQIFFIQVGGYDTHTNQNSFTQTGNATTTFGTNVTNNLILGGQANLLAELSQALGAFYAAMGDLGTLRGDSQMQKRALAFTVSDFARTFPSNGSGSDHGWGSHHMIVGGDVLGGLTYGKMPVLAVNGPSDTGTGRWIPTTAVDQYAATLASWYGVDGTHLPTIFPNLGRFASSNLGFLTNHTG